MKTTLAALTLATLLPAVALAAPTGDNAARARAHFKKGTELYKQARYSEAVAEFEAAYEAKPHGVLRYNIAQCHEKLGDIPSALRNYRAYLKEAPGAEDTEQVIAAIATLEKRLAATGLQQLFVYSDPTGAEVWIDGQVRGRTPFAIALPYGTHSVSLMKPGYRAMTRDTLLRPERPAAVTFALERWPSSTPANVPRQPAPMATPDPDFAGAQTFPQPVRPVVEPRQSRVWTWVALGVAGAATAAGAAYKLSAGNASGDAQRSRSRTGNILLAVGGVTGAAGVTLFFVEGSF